MNAIEDWQKVGTTRAYDGFVKINRVMFQEPGGAVSDWDIVAGLDSAAMLAFTPGGTHVVLFEQFRVGPARTLRELPGGYLAENELPESGARRELMEETGYAAGSTYYAGSEWWAANSTRRKHIVVAADASPAAAPSWGDSEMGQIHLLPREDLIEFLLSGNLTDAGLACRALMSFSRSSPVDPALEKLQRSVRSLLGPDCV